MEQNVDFDNWSLVNQLGSDQDGVRRYNDLLSIYKEPLERVAKLWLEGNTDLSTGWTHNFYKKIQDHGFHGKRIPVYGKFKDFIFIEFVRYISESIKVGIPKISSVVDNEQNLEFHCHAFQKTDVYSEYLERVKASYIDRVQDVIIREYANEALAKDIMKCTLSMKQDCNYSMWLSEKYTLNVQYVRQQQDKLRESLTEHMQSLVKSTVVQKCDKAVKCELDSLGFARVMN